VIPDLSVFWVVFFVLILSVILNGVFFKPLLRVMHEREAAIQSARALADQSAAKAEKATAEFESRLRTAQTDVYRELDEKRRVALEQRTALLTETRKEAEAQVASARQTLARDVEEARARLRLEADELGSAVAERILGRRVS